MTSGNVEVVDDVAVVILVHPDPRRRRGAERELQAALRALAARLHARLHHALADGRFVDEAGHVADVELHSLPRVLVLPRQAGSADSIG